MGAAGVHAPDGGQPLRVAEFDALFATATTECCSFFTFTLTLTAGKLTLGVSAGEPHVEVLDALEARAS